jgi:hypothetical protein
MPKRRRAVGRAATGKSADNVNIWRASEGRMAKQTSGCAVIEAQRDTRRALVRSTFNLAADFAQAEATGARRDFVQQLTRVDLLVLEIFVRRARL